MRENIRKIIKEETERIETERKILDYEGSKTFLLNLKIQLLGGKRLSDSQILTAQLALGEDEPIFNNLTKKNKDSMITKGKETYSKLLNKTKLEENEPINKLLETILLNSHYRIGSPSDQWYVKNIDDLNFLNENFKSSAGHIKWMDGSHLTFEEKIQELLNKCDNKDFVGIVEIQGDEVEWSLLNKVDTNTFNWIELIKDRHKKKDIKGTTLDSLIDDYFQLKNIGSIPKDSKLTSMINKTEQKYDLSINKMSFAELDLIEAFEEEGMKLEKITKRIHKTSERGDTHEANFMRLINNFKDSITDIHNFSTPGNLVDTVFGIDLALNIVGHKYIVQIKSDEQSARKSFIRKLGVPYLCIFPKGSSSENLEFKYITKSHGQERIGSFNEQLYKAIGKKYRENSKKEEENEGAGAYAAPAFEMEPNHTTFKKHVDYNPAFKKQVKLKESSIKRRVDKKSLDRQFDDAVTLFFNNRELPTKRHLSLEQFKLEIVNDLIESIEGKFRGGKDIPYKELTDMLYDEYADKIELIYNRKIRNLNETYNRLLLREFSEKFIKNLIEKFKKEEPSLSEAVIRNYIQRFKEISSKLENKDINTYTWEELEIAVDSNSIQKRIKAGKINDGEPESDSNLIYNKDNIRIYLGKDKKSCIKYGNGYSFCISARSERNQYDRYRFDQKGTPYFIFDDTKTSEQREDGTFIDPTHVLVVFVYSHEKGQTYSVTDASNRGDKKFSYFSWMVNEYPQLDRFQNLLKPLEDVAGEKIYKLTKEFEKILYQSDSSNTEFQNQLYDTVKEVYTREGIVGLTKFVVAALKPGAIMYEYHINFQVLGKRFFFVPSSFVGAGVERNMSQEELKKKIGQVAKKHTEKILKDDDGKTLDKENIDYEFYSFKVEEDSKFREYLSSLMKILQKYGKEISELQNT